MSDRTRWHVVPRTRGLSFAWLLAGIVLLLGAVLQMRDGAEPLLVVSAVLAVVLVALSVVGLVSPRLRGR